jgi:hypothetical protein
MSAVQYAAGNPDDLDVALGLVRDRLAGLGRQYTPVDVATAMQAEGVMCATQPYFDTLESLRRHGVGAGPISDFLSKPMYAGSPSAWQLRLGGTSTTRNRELTYGK